MDTLSLEAGLHFGERLLRLDLTAQQLPGYWSPDFSTSYLLSANLAGVETQLPEILDFTKISQEMSDTD